MFGDDERKRDLRYLEEILENGPRTELPPAGAKVCQACGELGTWNTEDGYAAGHVNGGDFVGFSPGHADCEWSPYPAHLRHRPTRHCEVCRVRVAGGDPRLRVGLSWLSESCAEPIAASGHDPVAVLGDLALRRFAVIGGHRPHGAVGVELVDELGDDLEPATVLPPADWLPAGLALCGSCGEARGETPAPEDDGTIGVRESLCTCAGPACTRCGRPRTRKPTSDYYDAADGSWIHVPYFVGYQQLCRDCGPARG